MSKKDKRFYEIAEEIIKKAQANNSFKIYKNENYCKNNDVVANELERLGIVYDNDGYKMFLTHLGKSLYNTKNIKNELKKIIEPKEKKELKIAKWQLVVAIIGIFIFIIGIVFPILFVKVFH